MLDYIWNLTFFIFWLIMIIIRFPYVKLYEQFKNKSKFNLTEETIILLWGLGFNVFPIIYIITGLPTRYNINLPIYVRLIGIGILLTSVIVLQWTHKTLGKNWSPTVDLIKNHKLITIGPFKYVRHPMYTSIWLRAIGQFLLLSNWFVGLVGIIIWLCIYPLRVSSEEKMLKQKFGKNYIKYMKTTGRILPKLFKQ